MPEIVDPDKYKEYSTNFKYIDALESFKVFCSTVADEAYALRPILVHEYTVMQKHPGDWICGKENITSSEESTDDELCIRRLAR